MVEAGNILIKSLATLIPAAYLISNKTVLTLHNFRFPSIFLSWQLSIALGTIIIIYRRFLLSFTLNDFRSALISAFLYTISMYFGSRALAVLPIPVFISAQILGTHMVEGIIHLKNAKSMSPVIIQTCNSVFMVPLFVLLSSEIEFKTLIHLLYHVAAFSFRWFLIRSEFRTEIESHVKQTIAQSATAVAFLLFYGTMSGEIIQAGHYDFSKTHFKVYLFLSGILSALACLIRGVSARGHLQYHSVFQYVVILIFGYYYDYNGDVTLFRDLVISFYFVFLLFLDTYFSRATIDNTVNVSPLTNHDEII